MSYNDDTVMCVLSYVVDQVYGVTVLNNIMYVVCLESSTILLYNTDTYSPLDVVINVTGMKWPCDIIVCRDDRQLYIADYMHKDNCIWRVSADDHSDQEKWLPTESTTLTLPVNKLSVTSRRLLVASSHSLNEYSTTDRQLLRVVQLPWCMDLFHGVETTRGTFVICHRGTSQDKRQYAVSELIVLCHALVISVTISLLAVTNDILF